MSLIVHSIKQCNRLRLVLIPHFNSIRIYKVTEGPSCLYTYSFPIKYREHKYGLMCKNSYMLRSQRTINRQTTYKVITRKKVVCVCAIYTSREISPVFYLLQFSVVHITSFFEALLITVMFYVKLL